MLPVAQRDTTINRSSMAGAGNIKELRQPKPLRITEEIIMNLFCFFPRVKVLLSKGDSRDLKFKVSLLFIVASRAASSV
jgi:hypothetical protein